MPRREYEHDGREHAVELKDAGDHVLTATITSDGRRNDVTFLATPLGDGRWLIRLGGGLNEVHEVRVERDASGPGLSVRFREGTIRLERLDPFREALRAGRAGAGIRRITAPIPGRILDVLVAPGDMVTTGQPCVIVEAMKMANELRSPVDGRVASVAAAKGAAVEAGAILVVIEG